MASTLHRGHMKVREREATPMKKNKKEKKNYIALQNLGRDQINFLFKVSINGSYYFLLLGPFL